MHLLTYHPDSLSSATEVQPYSIQRTTGEIESYRQFIICFLIEWSYTTVFNNNGKISSYVDAIETIFEQKDNSTEKQIGNFSASNLYFKPMGSYTVPWKLPRFIKTEWNFTIPKKCFII